MTQLGEGSALAPWTIDPSIHQSEFKIVLKLGSPQDDLNWGWITVEGAKAEANARLVIKAPLLIEAKEMLSNLVGRFGGSGTSVLDHVAIKQARILLAKLENED